MQSLRAGQVAASALVVAGLLTLVGILMLAQRDPGCPHDHSGPVSQCLDTSTYSPHVTQAWIVIGLGAAVAMVTLVSRRRAGQAPTV